MGVVRGHPPRKGCHAPESARQPLRAHDCGGGKAVLFYFLTDAVATSGNSNMPGKLHMVDARTSEALWKEGEMDLSSYSHQAIDIIGDTIHIQMGPTPRYAGTSISLTSAAVASWHWRPPGPFKGNQRMYCSEPTCSSLASTAAAVPRQSSRRTARAIQCAASHSRNCSKARSTPGAWISRQAGTVWK